MRSDLLQRLQKAVHDFDKSYVVRPFGSYAAGLYLPNADMDVVILSGEFMSTGRPQAGQSPKQMYKLAEHLKEANVATPTSIEILPKTKVPLIKFLDPKTSLRVDMSFENLTGVTANQTFQEWKTKYPAMPVLVTVIKQFLLMRGMNEVHSGGLGGFTVTCLVTSLLQNSTRMQDGQFVPELNLGELLLEFLDFYGNHFEFQQVAIVLDPPGYREKASDLPTVIQ